MVLWPVRSTFDSSGNGLILKYGLIRKEYSCCGPPLDFSLPPHFTKRDGKEAIGGEVTARAPGYFYKAECHFVSYPWRLYGLRSSARRLNQQAYQGVY